MTTTYEHDTQQTLELKNKLMNKERNLTGLQMQIRDIMREIDAERLKLKPDFPTEAHILGIETAVSRNNTYVAKSNHGDAAGPENDPWAVISTRGWMNVRHGSPFSELNRGGWLWKFTDEDIEKLLMLVRLAGAKVTEFWPSDGGVSIRFVVGEEI